MPDDASVTHRTWASLVHRDRGPFVQFAGGTLALAGERLSFEPGALERRKPYARTWSIEVSDIAAVTTAPETSGFGVRVLIWQRRLVVTSRTRKSATFITGRWRSWLALLSDRTG